MEGLNEEGRGGEEAGRGRQRGGGGEERIYMDTFKLNVFCISELVRSKEKTCNLLYTKPGIF